MTYFMIIGIEMESSSSLDDLTRNYSDDGGQDGPSDVFKTLEETGDFDDDRGSTGEAVLVGTPEDTEKMVVAMRCVSKSDVKDTYGNHRRQIFSTGDIDSTQHKDDDTLPVLESCSNLDIEAQKYRRDLGRVGGMKTRRKPSRNTIAGFSSLRDEWAFEDSTEVKKMFEDGMAEEEGEEEESEPTPPPSKTTRSHSGSKASQLSGVNQADLLLGISRSRNRRHTKNDTGSPQSNSPRTTGDKAPLQPSWMQEALTKKKVQDVNTTTGPTTTTTVTVTRPESHTTGSFSDIAKSKAITRPPWLHDMHKNTPTNSNTEPQTRESKLKSPVMSPRNEEHSQRPHLSPRPRLHPMSDLQKSPAVPRKPKPHEHPHGPIRATATLDGAGPQQVKGSAIDPGRRSSTDDIKTPPRRVESESESGSRETRPVKHGPTYSKSSVEFGFVSRKSKFDSGGGAVKPPAFLNRTESDTNNSSSSRVVVSGQVSASGGLRKLQSSSLDGMIDGDSERPARKRDTIVPKNIHMSFDGSFASQKSAPGADLEKRGKRSKSEDSRKEERSKVTAPLDKDSSGIRTTFPQWQQDLLEKRRRSKDMSTPVVGTPEKPVEANKQSPKMPQTVPSWKKDLQEKRRSRLLQSAGESDTPTQAETEDEDPPSSWRKEGSVRSIKQAPTPVSKNNLDVVGKENQNNSKQQQQKQPGVAAELSVTDDQQRPAWLKHIRVTQPVNNSSQQQQRHGSLQNNNNNNNNNEPEWKMIAKKMKAKRSAAGDNM